MQSDTRKHEGCIYDGFDAKETVRDAARVALATKIARTEHADIIGFTADHLIVGRLASKTNDIYALNPIASQYVEDPTAEIDMGKRLSQKPMRYAFDWVPEQCWRCGNWHRKPIRVWDHTSNMGIGFWFS